MSMTAMRVGLLAAAGFVLALVLVVAADDAGASNMGATDGCGYQQGTSNENTQCISLQNNKWFAGRPSTFGNQWDGIDDAVQSALSGDYDPTDLVA